MSYPWQVMNTKRGLDEKIAEGKQFFEYACYPHEVDLYKRQLLELGITISASEPFVHQGVTICKVIAKYITQSV